MKEVSLKELDALRKSGAEIETHRQAFDIPAVAAELKNLVEKRQDNGALLEGIAAIIKAIEQVSITVNPTDLKPILDAVRLIKNDVVERPDPKPCAYRFEVSRDNRQMLTAVIATPIADET